MARVAEIAVQYAARGAKAAQRADRQVRDSIQTTAKTAQSEQGTISRWMERHQSAVKMVGAATAGALGSIVAASPTMRAELAGVRTAFSLFADTVVNDVLPQGASLTDMAFDLLDAFEDLPGPIREFVSVALVAGGVLGTVAIGASILGGILSGPLLLAVGLVAAIAGVLYVAWSNNWLGIQDIVLGVVDRLLDALGWLLDFIGADSWRERMEMIHELWLNLGRFVAGVFRDLITSAIDWGRDLPGRLAEGIRQRLGQARNAAANVRDSIFERIPEPLQDAIEWGRDVPSRLSEGILDRISRARSAARDVRNAIRSRITGLRDRAYDWGRDIITFLVDGIRNAYSELRDAVGGARDIIEDSLSFDIRANDMQAMRWGEDLMQWMARGADAGRPDLESAVRSPQLAPQAAPAGGGGATIVFESGAIQVDGAGSPRRTAERTADEVSQSIRDDFGALRG